MSVKFLDGGNIGNINQSGERLVARYVHSGNPVLTPVSVDYATAIITFGEPHGLAVNTTVLITPDYIGTDSPHKDALTIPHEWNISTTAPTLVPIDATTAKLTKADGTTALTANLTSTENNNNLGTIKYHFELPIAWQIDNIPLLRRFRYRTIGYVKGFTNRYMMFNFLYSDNTSVWVGMLGFLQPPNLSPVNAFNALYGIQDYRIDITSNLVEIESDNFWEGRRTGFNSYVTSTFRELVKRYDIQSNAKVIVGIQGVKVYGVSFATYANGTIVEVYDCGY